MRLAASDLIIIVIVVFFLFGGKLFGAGKKKEEAKGSREPSIKPVDQKWRQEKEERRREEERKQQIEQVKAEIHEVAQQHVYMSGDKKNGIITGDILMFIEPQFKEFDRLRAEILEELADGMHGDGSIKHEAQWIWSLKYLFCRHDDLSNGELSSQRAVDAAQSGIVPALIFCLDDYKYRGLEDQAVACLDKIADKEKETASVIMLEWKDEGFFFEKDGSARAELLNYARSNQDSPAHHRARWYLDQIGVDYKN